MESCPSCTASTQGSDRFCPACGCELLSSNQNKHKQGSKIGLALGIGALCAEACALASATSTGLVLIASAAVLALIGIVKGNRIVSIGALVVAGVILLIIVPYKVTTDTAEGISSWNLGTKVTEINATVNKAIDNNGYWVLTYTIDRVVQCLSIGHQTAPPNSTYLVVYFSIRNDGEVTTHPISNPFVITTDDGKIFASDNGGANEASLDQIEQGNMLKNADMFTDLQPGVQSNFVTAFLLPIDELQKHPTIFVQDGGLGKKISLQGIAEDTSNQTPEPGTASLPMPRFAPSPKSETPQLDYYTGKPMPPITGLPVIDYGSSGNITPDYNSNQSTSSPNSTSEGSNY